MNITTINIVSGDASDLLHTHRLSGAVFRLPGSAQGRGVKAIFHRVEVLSKHL